MLREAGLRVKASYQTSGRLAVVALEQPAQSLVALDRASTVGGSSAGSTGRR